jgi:hypothetical protein
MTKKAPSLTAASQPLPEANGYYSLDDQKRMKALVRALLEGGRPIALSSASSDTLDHYSRLLVRDLRQHDHVKVVAHLPGSSDQLVQQINGLLADLPLSDVVTRDPAAARPVHIFVVHDSPTLSSAEFALLVRLVHDLPGANLRIALIQDRDFAVTGNLEVLGAQALHWRIQVAGMPASISSQATREAMREALLESPETLPPWAVTHEAKPARRRWRLAFWRRDETHSGAKTRVPNGQAPSGKTVAGSRKASSPAAAKPLARPTARAALKPLAKTSAKPAGKAPTGQRKTAPAPAIDSVARRNRMVLVSGVILSAALAGGLGTWLSIQPSANRGAQPGPMTTPTSPATGAAIALRSRP